MEDKFFMLYADEDTGVRHLAEVKVESDKSIKKPIGIQIYRNYKGSSLPREIGQDSDYLANGSYPVLSQETFNPLYGKMMQICDAMISEKEQRDAFKGLVKEELSNWYDKNVGYTLKMSEQLNKLK